MRVPILVVLVAVTSLLGLPLSASALPIYGTLTPSTSFMVNGTGLGAVNTLVTMGGISGETYESGCSTTDACTGYPTLAYDPGFVGKYEGINQLVALDSIITAGQTAADVALVFNPNETGQDYIVSSVLLNAISLGIYDSTGVLLAVYTYADEPILMQSPGTGSSGYFQFNPVGGTEYAFGGGYRIGAAFWASEVNNGPETVWAVQSGSQTAVPDAGGTLLLLGMGLVGLRAWRKRLG